MNIFQKILGKEPNPTEQPKSRLQDFQERESQTLDTEAMRRIGGGQAVQAPKKLSDWNAPCSSFMYQ